MTLQPGADVQVEVRWNPDTRQWEVVYSEQSGPASGFRAVAATRRRKRAAHEWARGFCTALTWVNPNRKIELIPVTKAGAYQPDGGSYGHDSPVDPG